MLNNNAAYKYKTPHKGPFLMVTLQCGAIKLGMLYAKLRHIHMIQTLKILTKKLMIENIKLGEYFLHNTVFIIKAWNKLYNQMQT